LLENALLATEDIRFYRHNGIDVEAWEECLSNQFSLPQKFGGGSTITQQLAKNLYPRARHGFMATSCQ